MDGKDLVIVGLVGVGAYFAYKYLSQRNNRETEQFSKPNNNGGGTAIDPTKYITIGDDEYGGQYYVIFYNSDKTIDDSKTRWMTLDEINQLFKSGYKELA